MTGIPSIVAGLFICLLDADPGLRPSGFAGSLALAILMMPVVVRSTEEMLKLVPNELREASLALGVPKWRTILEGGPADRHRRHHHGRHAGDRPYRRRDGPVLLLVFGTASSTTTRSRVRRRRCRCTSTAVPQSRPDAATTAPGRRRLTLIAFVMILNLVARGIARWKAPKTGR